MNVKARLLLVNTFNDHERQAASSASTDSVYTQSTVTVLQSSLVSQPRGRADGVPSARANILVHTDTAQNCITDTLLCYSDGIVNQF
jgi:hypothetical protein